jgi:predicted enzyme related to lactoylglutathione lyase
MVNKTMTHGAFSWCELLTTDVAGAKEFYSKLFNWSLQPAPAPGMDYTLVACSDQQIGGMMAIPAGAQGMPPHWGVYVTVDDVDASAQAAVALGGKICKEPQDIPQVGRFCVLQDPQGAYINIISYLQKTC